MKRHSKGDARPEQDRHNRQKIREAQVNHARTPGKRAQSLQFPSRVGHEQASTGSHHVVHQ